MSSPALWLTFIGLFLMAGALNILRGLRRPASDPRRAVNLALGTASLLWATAAGILRFVAIPPGFALGAIAACLMVYAAILSTHTSR